MHVSLYRKYRPQKFSDVIGQSAATDLLRSSFTEGRLGHAYLFSGPRGCGKTTAARLLAKVVNCQNPSPTGEPCCTCASCVSVVAGDHMDVMEIDGASNRGIDQIRELKSHVGLSSFMGGVKVYILDEVHMLTMEAFNALLKTLEEPPTSVLFIFATTEPHKVPVTIRSRCQHIPFHRIGAEEIVARLRFVASEEGFEAEDAALWEIARSADGALRDALSLAEQGVALGGGALSSAAIRGLFGGGSRGELEGWVSKIRTDPAEAAAMLKDLLEHGVSPERLLDTLFPLLRDMWVYSLWGERAFDGISLSEEEKNFLRAEAPAWTSEQLRRASAACTALFPRARWGLRADNFAGLILFEMLGVFSENISAPAPAAPAAPTVPVAPVATALPVAPVPASAPPLARSLMPQRAVEPEPEWPEFPPFAEPQPGEAPVFHQTPVAREKTREKTNAANPIELQEPSEPPDDLPDLLKRLWLNDLPLCAALLDVRISVADDGSPAFDYSEASAVVCATLETPRAQAAIALAMGVTATAAVSAPPLPARPADRAEHSDVPSSPSKAQTARRTTDARGMSLEELSAYLGADLLMVKSVAPGDSDDLFGEDDAE